MSTSRVAVLLATYNGDKWLDEQLQSIADQDFEGQIDVCASDDGSSDTTMEILEAWQHRWQRGAFVVLDGPRSGFADNFRSLVLRNKTDADYTCFSDQDDIWLKDKIKTAVSAMSTAEIPTIYGSSLIAANECGIPGRLVLEFKRNPSFRNALVENIFSGNTILLNRSAFNIVVEAAQRTKHVAHDWFSYLIISGCGGKLVYSLTPYILYRQHGANVIGASRGLALNVRRMYRALRGDYREWTDSTIQALHACRSMLTDEAVATLDLFTAARTGTLPSRLRSLRKSGVYRQTITGNIKLHIACILKRI